MVDSRQAKVLFIGFDVNLFSFDKRVLSFRDCSFGSSFQSLTIVLVVTYLATDRELLNDVMS